MLLAERQRASIAAPSWCASLVQCSNYQLAFDKYIEAASLTQRCIWINNSAASGSRRSGLISSCAYALFCEREGFASCASYLLHRVCVCCLFALPLDNSRTNDRICSFNAATAASGDKFARALCSERQRAAHRMLFRHPQTVRDDE